MVSGILCMLCIAYDRIIQPDGARGYERKKNFYHGVHGVSRRNENYGLPIFNPYATYSAGCRITAPENFGA